MPAGVPFLTQLLGGGGSADNFSGGGNGQQMLMQFLQSLGFNVNGLSNGRPIPRQGMKTASANTTPTGPTGGFSTAPPQVGGFTPPSPWMIPSGPNGEMQLAPYQTPQWSPVQGTPVAGGGLWYPYGWRGSTITGGELNGQRATLLPSDPNAKVGDMTNAYMAQRAAEAEYRPPNGQPWWTTSTGAPTLTDPNTGIYHYELYTPEYQKAMEQPLRHYRRRGVEPPTP